MLQLTRNQAEDMCTILENSFNWTMFAESPEDLLSTQTENFTEWCQNYCETFGLQLPKDLARGGEEFAAAYKMALED